MFFSVVVPLFNKRLHIRRCVESILRQTFSDFELIIVDDGSTDGSTDEIGDVDDPRLTIVRQSNAGEGPARNAGMQLARGAYIAFLDADDAWLPIHLAELARIGTLFPRAGLIATTFFEADDKQIPTLPQRKNLYLRKEIDYFKEAGRKIGVVWVGSAAIRYDVYTTIGGFINVRAGADLEYWARVALKFPVATSERITSIYFRNTGGVMETIEHENSTLIDIRIPEHLRDVSPSIAMLCDRAVVDADLLNTSNIRAYINGRITAGAPRSFFTGSAVLNRSMMRHLLKPLNSRENLLTIISTMPTWLLSIVEIFYQFAKTVYLKVRQLTHVLRGKFSNLYPYWQRQASTVFNKSVRVLKNPFLVYIFTSNWLKYYFGIYILRDESRLNLKKWRDDFGDASLRLDYPLSSASIVFDVGGYKGDFAEAIYSRFKCYVYILEPSERFYNECVSRFQGIEKIRCFNFGLSDTDGYFYLSDDDNASSVTRSNNNREKENVVLKRFRYDLFMLKCNTIDLMKINIEGGEFLILPYLIEQGLLPSIRNIQVQFHDFYPNAHILRDEIREKLSETHYCIWNYPFIWESWTLKP